MAMMESEIDLLQVEKRIRNRVKADRISARVPSERANESDSERTRRDGRRPDENEALKRKIDAAKMPKEAKEKPKRNCRS